jgi:hypothetical protein
MDNTWLADKQLALEREVRIYNVEAHLLVYSILFSKFINDSGCERFMCDICVVLLEVANRRADRCNAPCNHAILQMSNVTSGPSLGEKR